MSAENSDAAKDNTYGKNIYQAPNGAVFGPSAVQIGEAILRRAVRNGEESAELKAPSVEQTPVTPPDNTVLDKMGAIALPVGLAGLICTIALYTHEDELLLLALAVGLLSYVGLQHFFDDPKE